VADVAAMYSASAVDRVVTGCFPEYQDIGVFPNRNRYPVTDL
jgi:hypothetical protein